MARTPAPRGRHPIPETIMSRAVETKLLTAGEFGLRPHPGYPEELIRGEVVAMPQPGRRHGQVCYRAARVLGHYIEQHDLGHVLTNDSGVITERNPDTVRGADVAYYGYARLPKGPLPEGYGPEVPDLVIEVRSPSERWSDLYRKIGEYLDVGVRAVVVLEPEARIAQVFFPDAMPQKLGPEEELTLPEILGDFRVPVGQFFP
jgi:Uma2 family endonuclease